MLTLDLSFDESNSSVTIEELSNQRIHNPNVVNYIIKMNDYVTTQPSNKFITKFKEFSSNCKFIGHGTRRFDINPPNNPIYTGYVCISPTEIIKVINCQTDIYADFMVLKEMAFQKYAQELSSTCNFEAPIIKEYGRFEVTEDILEDDPDFKGFKFNCFWYFIMNKLQYNNLKSSLSNINLDDASTCDTLSRKISSVNKCLTEHNVFHNDFHEENVFFNDKTFDIGVIDYGEAESYLNKFKDEWNYPCEQLKKIKSRNNDSSRSITPFTDNEASDISPLSPITTSGGKTKSKRKHKTKSKRSRKTKKRSKTKKRQSCMKKY